MKYLIFTVCNIIALSGIFAQPGQKIASSKAIDINCNEGHFWGIDGSNNIIEFSIEEDTVVIIDTTIKTPSNLYNGLAYANNLTNGNGLTLYADDENGHPVYFDGTSWVNTNVNPEKGYLTAINPGGFGNYVYYESYTQIGMTKAILRFDGSSLHKIYEAPKGKAFRVADLAVDGQGNCWVIIGDDDIVKTVISDSIFAISPEGNVIKKYPFKADLTNAYGSFFIEDILYIGIGFNNQLYKNTLLPIHFSSGEAVAGTPIKMKEMQTLNDLAACNAIIETSLKSAGNSTPKLYPVPTTDILNIQNSNIMDSEYHIYNSEGLLVSTFKASGELTTIDLQLLTPGLYFIKSNNPKSNFSKTFIKN